MTLAHLHRHQPAHVLPYLRSVTNLSQMEVAILKTIAYGDIFDYPLRLPEIHRYLLEIVATPGEVFGALQYSARLGSWITQRAGYYCLRGREETFAIRQERGQLSARRWPIAMRYGRLVTGLPFVRMVAVTGSLAMDNASQTSDLDFLIVTAGARLWLCRLMVLALARMAALLGDRLCPNYIISENALEFSQQDLYTAHETLQMAPLSGLNVYAKMRLINAWTGRYLPNAGGPPPRAIFGRQAPRPGPLRRSVETGLGGRLGATLERWEMERKIRKLTRQAPEAVETSFCADWCKGHFDGYRQKTLAAFAARLESLGMVPSDHPEQWSQ